VTSDIFIGLLRGLNVLYSSYHLFFIQDPTVGRSSHHHHRHICVPLFRQIWYVIHLDRFKLLTDICASQCFTFYYISVGLRKLEAFFGFLITVMALSFGYEVKFLHLSNVI